MKNKTPLRRPFSLLKLFLTTSLLVTIATAIILTINPIRQQTSIDNSRRESDITQIANALSQYIYHNEKKVPDGLSGKPAQISSHEIDLCSKLIPDFAFSLPTDPSLNKLPIQKPCPSEYNTGYYIQMDTEQSFTITAPYESSQNNNPISVTRTIHR